MASGRRGYAKGVCCTLLVLACLAGMHAQVSLVHPMANSPFDALDSLKATDVCGHNRSGHGDSLHWRNFGALNVTRAVLTAGSAVNVSWWIAVPHGGGWRADLYNRNGTRLFKWADESHWNCTADGTQVSAALQLPPNVTCDDCTLRVMRQAVDTSRGPDYYYVSCAPVQIVASSRNATEESKCPQGCSGHGSCNEVTGRCECLSSAETGFWYGEYCSLENECEADTDCGPYGSCFDTKALAPPAKQCYCKRGYFGDVAVSGSGLIAARRCTRKSTLTLTESNITDDWDSKYSASLASPQGSLKLWFKLLETDDKIEFAVRAKTLSWVGIGLRPVQNSSVGNVTIDDPALPPPPAVWDAAGEGHCPVQGTDFTPKPTTYDAGTPPTLDDTLQGGAYNRPFLETPADGKYLTTDDRLATYFGTGACRAKLVNFVQRAASTLQPVPHPMTNQDMVIATANGDRFRIMDYFTPGRGTPRQDHIYGGRDGILDAIADETADGYTRIKFQRALSSEDPWDYCILKDIIYQVIYAYGQDRAAPKHSPPGTFELRTASASAESWYKDDVIMYHGGGLLRHAPVSFEGRGTLGRIDFYAAAQPSGACMAQSTLPDLSCMVELRKGEASLFYTLDKAAGLLRLAIQAPGNGWVGLGWSEQPGKMIGSNVVMAFGGGKGAGIYHLDAKDPSQVRPASNASMLLAGSPLVDYNAAANRLTLRFSRPLDGNLKADSPQNLIWAYNAEQQAVVQHTMRGWLSLNFETQSRSATSSLSASGSGRLNRSLVLLHAWGMLVAFGILLPGGIIFARYFKDIGRKWYLAHMAVQLTGVALALVAFLVAVARFHSDHKLTHMRLGIAVMVLTLVQPLTSLPRLCMHHDFVMRGYAWLSMHYMVGRTAVMLAWANIFLGVAAYRSQFGNLSHDAETAFAIYLGLLLMVALILEARTGRKNMQEQLLEQDELEKRMVALEGFVEAYQKAGDADSGEEYDPASSKPLMQPEDDDGIEMPYRVPR